MSPAAEPTAPPAPIAKAIDATSTAAFEEAMAAMTPEMIAALNAGAPPADPQDLAAPPPAPANPAPGTPAEGTQLGGTEGDSSMPGPAGAAGSAAAPEDLPNNWRISAGDDPVKKVALSLLRESPGLTLSEADARARQALGISEELPEVVGDQAPPEGSQPTELEARLAENSEKRKQALLDYNNEDLATLQTEHDALVLEQARAEARAILEERDAETQATAAHNQALAESRARCRALYGDQYKEGSALDRVATMLVEQLSANGDPRLQEPNAPEIIAGLAAQSLGLAPNTQASGTPAPASAAAGAQAPAASPFSGVQAPPHSTAQAAPIAPGSAHSTAPAAAAVPDFTSLEQYEEFAEKAYNLKRL